jgi:methyl-accepting chemotaxis protein
MKKMSLLKRMLVLILGPLFVILVASNYVSHHYAQKALNAQIEESMDSMTANYAGQVEKWLTDKESLVSTLAAEFGSRDMARDEIIRHFQVLKNAYPGVTQITVAFENKTIVTADGWTPPPGYDPTTRGWYQQGLAANGITYTDVFANAVDKKPTVSIVKPIQRDGKVIGVVGVNVDIAQLNTIVGGIKTGQTGYGFVLDGKGQFLAHPTLKLTDNIVAMNDGALKEYGQNFLSGNTRFQSFVYDGIEKFYSSTPIGKTRWVLVIGVPTAEVHAPLSAMRNQTILFSIIGILLITAVIFMVARNIAQKVRNLVVVAEAVAKGDLAVDIQTGKDGDELAILAESFRSMTVNLRNLVTSIAQSAEHIASASEQLTASAEQSAEGANHIAEVVTGVANDSNTQLRAVDQTRMVVEQVSTRVQQIADNARAVSGLADKASDVTANGQNQVDKAVEQMGSIGTITKQVQEAVDELASSSRHIGEIVDVIAGIAGQTNLLALNAAVEAARAGEQGKGFAVVAEEVRKLAEQSQTAAQQITEVIAKNQGNIDRAVQSMNLQVNGVQTGIGVVDKAGGAFGDIAQLINEVSTQIKGISGGIQELAASSQQIVAAVRDIDMASRNTAGQTQTVSATVEEQSATMHEITTASQQMAQMAQEFHALIKEFKL